MIPDLVPPPTWTVVVFVLVILAVQAVLLYAVSQVSSRWMPAAALLFLGVLIMTGYWAESGMLFRQPQRVLAYAAATNLFALLLALSGVGLALSRAMLPAFWVLFHAFRLPLEIVLDVWWRAGTIPKQMTWHGQNLDIVTGLLALLLGGFFWARPNARWAAWTVHVVGLGLLANVMRIAITSAPTSLKMFAGDPLVLPFHVPYTWILPFAVGAAFFAHVVGVRGLIAQRHELATG